MPSFRDEVRGSSRVSSSSNLEVNRYSNRPSTTGPAGERGNSKNYRERNDTEYGETETGFTTESPDMPGAKLARSRRRVSQESENEVDSTRKKTDCGGIATKSRDTRRGRDEDRGSDGSDSNLEGKKRPDRHRRGGSRDSSESPRQRMHRRKDEDYPSRRDTRSGPTHDFDRASRRREEGGLRYREDGGRHERRDYNDHPRRYGRNEDDLRRELRRRDHYEEGRRNNYNEDNRGYGDRDMGRHRQQEGSRDNRPSSRQDEVRGYGSSGNITYRSDGRGRGDRDEGYNRESFIEGRNYRHEDHHTGGYENRRQFPPPPTDANNDRKQYAQTNDYANEGSNGHGGWDNWSHGQTRRPPPPGIMPSATNRNDWNYDSQWGAVGKQGNGWIEAGGTVGTNRRDDEQGWEGRGGGSGGHGGWNEMGGEGDRRRGGEGWSNDVGGHRTGTRGSWNDDNGFSLQRERLTMDTDKLADDMRPHEQYAEWELSGEYQEHPDITRMSEKEVDEFRRELGVTVSVAKGSSMPPKPIRRFIEACLNDTITEKLESTFAAPTSIQSQAFPIAVRGKDLIGVSETGSGKTLAFLLPVVPHVHRLRLAAESAQNAPHQTGPIALILVPTRELALQIVEECNRFLKDQGITSLLVTGGRSRDNQISQLRLNPDLVVGAPGRIMDLYNAGELKFSRVSYYVLDECDRLLDQGFEKAIYQITSCIDKKRQTLVWSATWPPEVHALSQRLFRNADEVFKIVVGDAKIHSVKTITHTFISVRNDQDRWFQFRNYLRDNYRHRIVVFAETKRESDRLVMGILNDVPSCRARAIHGDKEQRERDLAMREFRTGTTNVIVGTDLLQRGLDFKDVYAVVNYRFPKEERSYIHRSGRTGRAGASGVAITFYDQYELEANMGVAYKIAEALAITDSNGQDTSNLSSLLKNLTSRYSYGNEGTSYSANEVLTSAGSPIEGEAGTATNLLNNSSEFDWDNDAGRNDLDNKRGGWDEQSGGGGGWDVGT